MGLAFAPAWEGLGKALQKLEDRQFAQLTDSEKILLETLFEKRGRPTTYIGERGYRRLPPPWDHFNANSVRLRLEEVLPGIGRVDLLFGRNTTPVGTCFVVGEKLLMTTRQVAEVFVQGIGQPSAPLELKPGLTPIFNPAEYESASYQQHVSITGIRMVHPHWDMALLETAETLAEFGVLQLSTRPPEAVDRLDVAVIGYPSRIPSPQPLLAELLSDYELTDNKRMAPGIVLGRETATSYGHPVEALRHDSSTLVTSSGAALIDVATSHVVGLHFQSSFFGANYAVPAADLAQDRRVVEAGVKFAGPVTIDPKWDAVWEAAGKAPAAQPASPAAKDPSRPPADPALLPATYPAGIITQRLEALSLTIKEHGTPEDHLRPYRHAAAVLAAFDPAALLPLQPSPGVSAFSLEDDVVRNPYRQQHGDPPWSLATQVRKTALRELRTPTAMQQALKANPGAATAAGPVQQILTRAIHMAPPFVPEQMPASELPILATVAEWLEGTEPGASLPSALDLYTLIDSHRDRELLRSLATPTFTGREAELRLLQAHFQSIRPDLLFIAGVGGLGKSALISQALLDWEKLPTAAVGHLWVRIDMHDALIQPDQPLSLFRQVAVQLRRTYPKMQHRFSGFIEGLSKLERRVTQQQQTQQLESVSTGDRSNESVIQTFLDILDDALDTENSRLVLWLDTFEEVQFLGANVEYSVLHLLHDLGCQLPRLRILVSGRTAPGERVQHTFKPEGTPHGEEAPSPLKIVPLPNLPPKATTLLLTRLLDHEAKARPAPPERAPLTPQLIRQIATGLGGNPLNLRLAARILHAEGRQGLGDLKETVLQKRLISRVIYHLHDEGRDLEKLVLPGLQVRVITPAVIQHVLAIPCGMGKLGEGAADDLFQKMRRENTLVSPENNADNTPALRYRQDVRLIMLDGRNGQLDDKERQIHQNAVHHWQKESGPLARAEEIYHRLRLGQSDTLLNERWQAEAAPYLRSALEELPPDAPGSHWLASKLGTYVSDSGNATFTQDQLEKQVHAQAQQLLRDGHPSKALKMLREVKNRKNGSLLHALEARANLFLGHEEEALDVAERGIIACQDESKPAAVDAALLKAFIQERQGDMRAAYVTASSAANLAEAADSSILRLSTHLRVHRLMRLIIESENVTPKRKKPSSKDFWRKAWTWPTDEPSSQHFAQRIPAVHDPNHLNPNPVLKSALESVQPSELRAHPAVLREAAAEVGDHSHEILILAAEVLLDDLLTAIPPTDLVSLLSALGVVDSETYAILRSSGRQGEVVRLAHSRITELLYKSNTRAEQPVHRVLQNLFRQSVEAALHQEYLPPAKHPLRTKPPRRSRPARTLANHPKLRRGLVSLLQRQDLKRLHTLIRYVLEDDPSNSYYGHSPQEAALAMLSRAEDLHRVPSLLSALGEALGGGKSATLAQKLITKIFNQVYPDGVDPKAEAR